MPPGDIRSIARMGTNGYVINSVPFSIYAATQAAKIGLHDMYKSIIEAGGDTDTNASLAGQIAGALLGIENVPSELISTLKTLDKYAWVHEIIEKTTNYIG
jgi:ADP-ribosyl-[dinitrogen reductase] hydrolase